MGKQALRWLVARPIAHRGLHDLARDQPENTIAAFTAAMRAGYAIECDVRLSADSVPMIFHDDDLDRLTPESGALDLRSAEELGRIHVMRTQEVIPTLDDMLAEVMGRVPILIEMKPAGPRGRELVREVVKRIQSYDGPVALMSFDPDLVEEVRRLDRKIVRGLTAEGCRWRGLRHLMTAQRLNVDFISYSIEDLPTPGPLIARRLLRIPLISWTIRYPVQFAKAQTWTDQITFEGFRP